MNIRENSLLEESYLVGLSGLKRIQELGYSKAEIYRLVAPQRTLSRRKTSLSLQESDRVNRLVHIMEMAIRVFGSSDKANRWLRKPCRAMGGRIPVEMLISETGAREVEQELHRIDFGMFA